MIEIDKNVPIPARSTKRPWRQMEVGDSIFLAGIKVANAQLPPLLKAAGWQITRRTEDGGVRIWRIK